MIFKGKTIQQQWFPEVVDFLDGWIFKASEKGWVSDAIALKWLGEIFIPQTKPKTPSKRLLIINGHGSHCTDDFLYKCYKHDIFLLFLPPHSPRASCDRIYWTRCDSWYLERRCLCLFASFRVPRPFILSCSVDLGIPQRAAAFHCEMPFSTSVTAERILSSE